MPISVYSIPHNKALDFACHEINSEKVKTFQNKQLNQQIHTNVNDMELQMSTGAR